MKILIAALLCSGALSAQDLSLYVNNSGSLTPLPSTYALPSSAGTSTNVTLRVVNSSPNTIEIVGIVVSNAAGSTVKNPNFSVTDYDAPSILAPGAGFEDFTVTFTPSAAGQVSGYLVIAYAEQENGCSLSSTDPATECPTIIPTTNPLLQGNTTSLALTYNGTTATPGTSTPIYFGNIAIGSSASIVFTLTNQSTATLNVPTVAVNPPGGFAVSQFSIDTSSLPATLAGSASANFTVTFTPQANASGPANPEQATLMVGLNSYTLQGAALPPSGTPPGSDGLTSICTDGTGAHCQGTGNTITMGPDPTTMTLTFTVVNPNPVGTSYANLTAQPTLSSSSPNAFTLGAITLAPYASGVTGASSTESAGQSVTIQPGWAITFQVTYSPSAAATANATLAIASGITYNLTAKAPAPLNLTLMCGKSPCSGQTFTSQEQVQASLQWANSSSAEVPPDVTLALTFQSAVSGVTSDPAISFIAPANSMNIGPISFSQNSPTGTFSSSGQSQFTFQTGTTAGTITFTATGLENVTQSWSIDIPPSKVQITSVTAEPQASNVVVTIVGYDNTYSAGQLSFTFYNTAGQAIAPSPIVVNASSNFQQYFFTGNQAGGAFALQASFPVNGDVTQVGSVSATISNSIGSTAVTQPF